MTFGEYEAVSSLFLGILWVNLHVLLIEYCEDFDDRQTTSHVSNTDRCDGFERLFPDLFAKLFDSESLPS